MFNRNRIVDYGLQNTTHKKYDVFFYSDIIHTTVTHTQSIVDNWFSNVHFGDPVRVSLHVELLPTTENRRIAVLQLCTGRECLVFQIKHAPFVPRSLIAFLANEDHTFFGVGIRENVEILRRDYSLRVPNVVELRSLATDKLGQSRLMQADVQTLARRVLYKEVSKPQSVTNSNWGDRDLSKEQVQYACVNAFVSFKMGKRLYRRSS